MESAEFCGTTCHTTMEPEYAAYQVSAHARVAACRAMSGRAPARSSNRRSPARGSSGSCSPTTCRRPVPAPVRTMRPARETCENCHWPEKSHGDKLAPDPRIRRRREEHRDRDDAAAARRRRPRRARRRQRHPLAHEHRQPVEFIATDAQRQTIPWVKFTDGTGNVKEYTVEGTTPETAREGRATGRWTAWIATTGRRTPSSPSPSAPSTPRLRSATCRATCRSRGAKRWRRSRTDYASRRSRAGAASTRGCARRIARRPTDRRPLLARTIAAVQDIYARNVFPAMKVKWGTYPNNIGHVVFQGCFRCHDDNHKASDGSVIKQDCESCHAMP